MQTESEIIESMNLYSCAYLRSVRADGIKSAAQIFASRLARRAFGKSGHVGTFRVDAWTPKNDMIECEAFIGRSSGQNQMTGHNVRFTVCLRS